MERTELPDYYELLGVSKDATQDEIRHAYRQLSKKYHPDLNPNDSEKEEMFKKINNANEILTNPKKRAEYDKAYREQEEAKKQTRNENQRKEPNHSKHTKHSGFEYYTEQTFDAMKQFFSELGVEWEKRNKNPNEDLFNRHKEADETYCSHNEENIGFLKTLRRMFYHLGYEGYWNLRNLNPNYSDTIPQFIVKNRRNIMACLLATIMVFSLGNSKDEPIAEVTPNTQIIQTDEGKEEEYEDYEDYEQYRVLKYTEIKPGDNLTLLANDANCSISEIQQINEIENASHIEVGDKIILPYYIAKEDLKNATIPVEVNGNASLSSIAEMYSTDVQSITELNKEAFDENGDLITDSVVVPTFASQKELQNIRENPEKVMEKRN